MGAFRARARQGRILAAVSLAALLVGVAAVVLQVVEYTQLGFGPTDGGFASVFVGWTGFFAVVVLGTMVWLEIIVASAFRNGSRSAGLEPGPTSTRSAST